MNAPLQRRFQQCALTGGIASSRYHREYGGNVAPPQINYPRGSRKAVAVLFRQPAPWRASSRPQVQEKGRSLAAPA